MWYYPSKTAYKTNKPDDYNSWFVWILFDKDYFNIVIFSIARCILSTEIKDNRWNSLKIDTRLIFADFCPVFWEVLKKIREKLLADFCNFLEKYLLKFNKKLDLAIDSKLALFYFKKFSLSIKINKNLFDPL